MFRYAILGPIELSDGERRVSVGGPRQVVLLALLLVHANRAVSADRLIDALWGQSSPAGALQSLHVAISRLRKTLGVHRVGVQRPLGTVSGGYLLTVGPGELDGDVFVARMEDGRRALLDGEARRAKRLLGEALGLWRGPALAEVAYEQFAQSEIRRLEELRLATLEARVDCRLQLGEHGGVIAELEALVVEHPGRERLAAQLMLALYRDGRQGEALDVFARTRAALSEQLGLQPGPALQTLQREILEHSSVLAAPVDACAAETRRPLRALPRPLRPAVGQLPFTGRERQYAYLADSWADVGVLDRRVVVISGEAGIGKTRAAAELAASVYDEGSLVLYGRCDEGLAVPYQPFVEALRRLLSTVSTEYLRSQLGGLAPELGRLLPELGDLGLPAPADAESARFALFEAVVAVLEVTTAQQRMLLVIDDVHWATPATLLLLRHVIRSERRLALLLVVTFRSTDLRPEGSLAELLADLQRDTSVRRMTLDGLDEQAIDLLLKAAVGPALADRAAQLVQRVLTETAGNPFFVRELVAHLLESDVFSAAGNGLAAALLLARLDIPEGLRGVVRHRVSRLSEPARQLMTIMAVAKGAVHVSLLDCLLSPRGLLDALDEAVGAGLLVECGRGEFDFAHALVHQAVYDDLGTARRLYLHRRFGEILESDGDTQKHVDALAHHFMQLALDGGADKAVSYAIAAGRAAMARLAYEDAAAHFQRGLDVLAQTQEPRTSRHIELLLGLGQTRWSTGEPDNARDAFKQAADIAKRINDAGAAADAALGFSGPLFFGLGSVSTETSEVLLRRALEMLDEHDSALRARVMGRLAAARAYAGGRSDHRALAYDALTMARETQDRPALADVLATCCWATRSPGTPGQHLQMARELTRLAEEVGDVPLIAYGRQLVIGYLLEKCDIEGFLRELDALEQFAKIRSDHSARWLLAAIHATHAHLEGQLASAESFATQALHVWADRPQFTPPAQLFAGQMIMLRREQGRLDELVELVGAYVRKTPEFPSWRCALAHIYAHLGNGDRARHELELLGDLSSLPRDGFWLLNLTWVGIAASLLDDHDRSRETYKLLLPYADTCLVAVSLLCEGSTARPLGMLATTLGRYDDAELHLERALEMNTRIRSPLWTAHTQYEYAHMLRLRDRPGDNDRARILLRTASATADALGLHALSRRASAVAGLTEGADSSLRRP